mgnify:FL=1
MKSSCLLTRRADMTRQAFREYYECSHAPLGMRYFPFQKYLRNHVLESSSEIDFDVIMESCFSDQVDVAAINHGDVRSIMDRDERTFMTQDLIRSASVDKKVLGGPPIDIAAPGTRRLMLLLNVRDSAIQPSLDEIARPWATDLACLPGVKRVSLDTAKRQVAGYGGFPCAAILSLWLEGSIPSVNALAAPDPLKLETCVLTQVYETPSEELAARYRS